jgi:hypothetical protein
MAVSDPLTTGAIQHGIGLRRGSVGDHGRESPSVDGSGARRVRIAGGGRSPLWLRRSWPFRPLHSPQQLVDTVVEVLVEQAEADALEGLGDGADLGE